jgi:hypothetical protein
LFIGPTGERTAWQTRASRQAFPVKQVHDFRRSAVNSLNNAGVSIKTAMGLVGHKTRAVFDRYDIVSETALVNAVARRDQYLAGQPGTRKVEPITQAKRG